MLTYRECVILFRGKPQTIQQLLVLSRRMQRMQRASPPSKEEMDRVNGSALCRIKAVALSLIDPFAQPRSQGLNCYITNISSGMA